ncbi:MAG: leucine-rich repeat domain-containing protein [Promethearchaeota archaeon]
MKIIKFIDGFITNSSSVGTTIVVALKKGLDLGEMLEKIGLSAEFASRFEDKYGTNEISLDWCVKDGILDSNIYDLHDYEILLGHITTHGFGGEIEDVDHSEFRTRFYDKIRVADLPLELINKDFILLHSIGEDLTYDHETKEDTKNRIWLVIEQLKNPEAQIEPRQPKSFEIRRSLEPAQKQVLEEFEKLIETRFPVVEEINISTIKDFLALKERDQYQAMEGLMPKIEGFKMEGGNIIALGFYFKINNQDRKNLPVSIAKLSYLKMLDLCFYRWVDIPETFGNPKSVEILRFPSYIKFKTSPESLGKMTSLKRLHISDCKGSILPESIRNLKDLEVLQLRNNNSKRLFFDEKGKIPTVIPKTIGNLKSLIILDLDYNNIETVPDSLGNLNSLQYLDLSGNYILKLPRTFGNLKELRSLNLYGNQLTSLPDSFRELGNLRSLSIGEEQIALLEKDPSSRKILSELRKKGVIIK